ncbi:uncharacterized protein LOC118558488 [Fundulus heteroclitus]|uniref:uncharacterized protein LOC118558488 n=1 Tax=Fundulus heteroclitus TaxID=8078 RepID=UPI00165CB0F8|nr:uncharacterized protein LOC118558488 [Fundulus heteroclitus]
MDSSLTQYLLSVIQSLPVSTEMFLQEHLHVLLQDVSPYFMGLAATLMSVLFAVVVTYKWRRNKNNKLPKKHKDETKDTTGGQKSKKNSTKMATPTQRMQDYQQSLKIILAMKRIYRLEDQINVSDTLQKTMENDLKAARKDLEKIDQQPEESEGLKATQLELESKMSEIRDLRKKLQEAKLHSEALAEKNRQKEAYLTEIKERYKQEFRKKIYEEQQWREEIDEEVEILKKKLEKKQSEVR